MAKVVLHGFLADKYGDSFELAVHSVGAAVRLLGANFPEFMRDIAGNDNGFHVKVDGVGLGEGRELVENHLCPEIHIVPVIAGAGGNNGFTQILTAAVIIVAAYYLGPAGASLFSGSTTSAMYAAGASMAISGVIGMLFSTGKQDDLANSVVTEDGTNYAFSGPVNTTSQGNPIPILYGKLRVGSQVISASITTVKPDDTSGLAATKANILRSFSDANKANPVVLPGAV